MSNHVSGSKASAPPVGRRTTPNPPEAATVALRYWGSIVHLPSMAKRPAGSGDGLQGNSE